ncbi:MAG: hypothetical protein R2771_07335 [Saprospiraceae bacterium]
MNLDLLDDANWNLYDNDSKAELTLSVENGLLPAYGLLPNKSVSVSIELLVGSILMELIILQIMLRLNLPMIFQVVILLMTKDSYPDDTLEMMP